MWNLDSFISNRFAPNEVTACQEGLMVAFVVVVFVKGRSYATMHCHHNIRKQSALACLHN